MTSRVLVVDNEQFRHDIVRRAVAAADVRLDLVATEAQLLHLVDDGVRWDVALVDFDLGRHWSSGLDRPRSTCGVGVMSLLRELDPELDLVAMTTPEDEVGQLFLVAAAEWFGAGGIDPHVATAAEIRDIVVDRSVDWAPGHLGPAVVGAARALTRLLGRPTTGKMAGRYSDFDWIRAYAAAHGSAQRLGQHLPSAPRQQNTVYDTVIDMIGHLAELRASFGGLDPLADRPSGAPATWLKQRDHPLLTFFQRSWRFFGDEDVAEAWRRAKPYLTPSDGAVAAGTVR